MKFCMKPICIFKLAFVNFYDFLMRAFSWTETRLGTRYVNIFEYTILDGCQLSMDLWNFGTQFDS